MVPQLLYYASICKKIGHVYQLTALGLQMLDVNHVKQETALGLVHQVHVYTCSDALL